MMDRQKIAELRIFLVRNISGGEQESCDLSYAIYPHAGELLALADVALKIRQAYQQYEKEDSAFSATGILSSTVVSAMRELDDLTNQEELSNDKTSGGCSK